MFAVSNSNTVTMSSREIAELTDKQHGHVMRDIRAMLESLGLDASRFGETYKDSANREQTEYKLPKDLTMTLMLGYDVAARFKVVKRLEALEGDPFAIITDPMTKLLMNQIMTTAKLENRTSSLEATTTVLEAKNAAQAAELERLKTVLNEQNNSTLFLTVVGYAKNNGHKLTEKEAGPLGKQASALCRANNIALGKTDHPRHGSVNTYPQHILSRVFQEWEESSELLTNK
jgi:phage regulator Rha-like protein